MCNSCAMKNIIISCMMVVLSTTSAYADAAFSQPRYSALTAGANEVYRQGIGTGLMEENPYMKFLFVSENESIDGCGGMVSYLRTYQKEADVAPSIYTNQMNGTCVRVERLSGIHTEGYVYSVLFSYTGKTDPLRVTVATVSLAEGGNSHFLADDTGDHFTDGSCLGLHGTPCYSSSGSGAYDLTFAYCATDECPLIYPFSGASCPAPDP